MAIQRPGSIQRLPNTASKTRTESRSGTLGHITLGRKQTGAPSAGNPHAGCDEAGAGNGLTVRIMRHFQGKLGANKIGRTYGAPRQSSTLPKIANDRVNTTWHLWRTDSRRKQQSLFSQFSSKRNHVCGPCCRLSLSCRRSPDRVARMGERIVFLVTGKYGNRIHLQPTLTYQTFLSTCRHLPESGLSTKKSI
jgi:hypothetical protein